MSEREFTLIGEQILGVGRNVRSISGIKIIDLSKTLCASKTDVPGDLGYSDPPTLIKKVPWVTTDVKPYYVTKLSFSPHSATHIDAPKHVTAEGKSTEDVSSELVGKCLIVNIKNLGVDEGNDLIQKIVKGQTIVAITGDADTVIDTSFRDEIIQAQPKAVVFGICVNCVGVDDTLAYCRNDIPMIMDAENLDALQDEDIVFALPIRISDVEASPVRLFAMRFIDATVDECSTYDKPWE